jgi:CRISPR-associated protein Cas2
VVVMILEKVPPSLRGTLSRWLMEPHTGVFVGKISALVRDKLWDMCTQRKGATGVVQIWTAANEQGFDMRTFGQTKRLPVNREGLWIIRKPCNDNDDKGCVTDSNDDDTSTAF